MTVAGWLQIALVLLAVLIAARPLGLYMTRVFQGERTRLSPVLGPVERAFYSASGVTPAKEQSWIGYTLSMLAFNAMGFAFLYALMRLQGVLPANPQGFAGVSPDLAFNTAISFVTNTNWQSYAGETTMSHLTQMVGLAVQNFLSAATGMALALVAIRAFSRSGIATVDEPQILRFLKPSLTAAGYEVITEQTGAGALKAAATHSPDVILLDLGLPDMDGKDVIARLREWSKTPIIIISARDRETEKISALDLGADDFVNKPFGIGELLARLRAALRHAAQQAGETAAFTSGDLVIDLAAHKVALAGAPVKLTPKEFDLLAILVRNAGRVVTHRQILTSVWGPAHTQDVQYLRVFIGQLRQKLSRDAEPDLIETEPGIGYRLVEPV